MASGASPSCAKPAMCDFITEMQLLPGPRQLPAKRPQAVRCVGDRAVEPHHRACASLHHRLTLFIGLDVQGWSTAALASRLVALRLESIASVPARCPAASRRRPRHRPGAHCARRCAAGRRRNTPSRHGSRLAIASSRKSRCVTPRSSGTAFAVDDQLVYRGDKRSKGRAEGFRPVIPICG
jgi:hypothetical protein